MSVRFSVPPNLFATFLFFFGRPRGANYPTGSWGGNTLAGGGGEGGGEGGVGVGR
jgi:hypothetical protein